MEHHLPIYLLKMSGILGILLLSYILFLRKETFFQTNRWYLLIGLALALVLPTLNYTKITTVIAPYTESVNYKQINTGDSQNTALLDFSLLLRLIYLIGVLFFTVRLLLQLLRIKQLKQQCQLITEAHYNLYESKEIIAPFSFFYNIFYTPKTYTPEELQSILMHEKAHAKQLHTWDLLVIQICCTLFWFNPLIWLYQHVIRQNLEFAADAYAVAKIHNAKDYQYLMLRESLGYSPTAITHQFFNSLIKNRIHMLQQKSSKKKHQLKVLFLLPALALFLLAFNVETKTIYTYKNIPQNVVNDTIDHVKIDNITITIDKNSTDEVLESDANFLAEQGVILEYKQLKRNSNGEITSLKIAYDNNNGSKGVYQQTKNEGTIAPFKISISFENNETAYIDILQEDSNSIPEAGQHRNTTPILKDKNSKLIELINTNGVEKIVLDGEEISRDSLSKIGKLEEQFIKTLHITESIDQDTEINEVKVEETNGDYKKITYLKQHSTPNNKRFLVTESNLSQKEKTALDGLEEIGKHKDITIHKKEITKENGKSISTTINEITSVPEKESTLQDQEEPLYYIDGKVATKKQIDKLSPDLIKSVNVLKGEKAVEKYGEKAQHGVIEITTKKKN
ncbi:M56 family metallopeptidase [Croceivirga sp. JEA036]|uniref:M56 family metallopeptidase n=1 Tax=Croceivirga sp. JEA036 TaxID=2721162 RepID=UPI001438E770|nr:M56 family metallopeptidase [Croceivirga sp. JEA036]NJB37429.1 hypothetical protein [Croceivirga sp. JEA036]